MKDDLELKVAKENAEITRKLEKDKADEIYVEAVKKKEKTINIFEAKNMDAVT